MVCEEAVRYEDLYLDGEMAPEERLRMEAHLAICPACRSRISEWIRIRAMVRERLGEIRAPASLRDTVTRRLIAQRVPVRRWTFPLVLATSMTMALVLGRVLWPAAHEGLPLEEHAVATHLAVAGPEVQGDRATIESFLRERVPFPVHIPLPDQPGIQLLGARIARIGSRPAVVYLYDAGGHRISVTQYDPSDGTLPVAPRVERRDGFTVVTYPDGGLLQMLVGDLPESTVTGIVPAAFRP